MITKAELEKMVNDEAEKKYPDTDNHWQQIALNGFKSGASFVAGILMPEIERVENNCDTLENKAIFWMETNDRAIEHTESLQLTITTLKTEIQSLKDEIEELNSIIDANTELNIKNNEYDLFQKGVHEREVQSLKDENKLIQSAMKLNFDKYIASCNELQKELSEAKETIEYLKSGVHTCHDQCPKPICVKFRDKDATIQSLKDENENYKRTIARFEKYLEESGEKALTKKAEDER